MAPSGKAATSLAVAAGGLVLRSEFRLQEAAQWTSWADTMKMVRARYPEVAETITQAMEARDEVLSFQAISWFRFAVRDLGVVDQFDTRSSRSWWIDCYAMLVRRRTGTTSGVRFDVARRYIAGIG